MTSVGVVVITHFAKKHLPFCLPPYLNSSLKPKVLVVNSSSNDGTVELAREMGAETLVIPRSEFNHGTTRERARKFINTDIVAMVTPDAYLVHPDMLEKLVEPIQQGVASLSYARQIPHDGAGFFEAYPRAFNYPESSHVRGIEDLQKLGVYTFFSSDSCAAYSNAALDSIGGFSPVLTGEDTLAAAKLLRQGHKVAYAAEAIVKHSHHYSLMQEFKRHFDTGLARRQYQEWIEAPGGDASRGKAYVKGMFSELGKKQPHLIPYAALHILAKWSGYQVGSQSVDAPLWFKKRLSGQDFYWVSKNNS